MITKDILKAQLELYVKGKAQALQAFEKARADLNAFNGAIEACENLLRIARDLEKGKQEGEQKLTNMEVKENGVT